MKRNILSILLVLALLITTIPFKASAAVTAEGSAGVGIYWKLYSDGQLYVSGKGAIRPMHTYVSQGNTGYWSNYTRNIKSVIITKGITSIGEGVFAHCQNLTSVSFADTVTEIGASAFWRCFGLKKVSLPKNLQTIGARAFGETGLASVSIPESVTSIGGSAFAKAALTQVTIPAGVAEFGGAVFSGCYALTSATFLAPLNGLPNATFSQCKVLQEVNFTGGLTGYIGENAFSGCVSLTSFTVPEGITEIRDSAFYQCSALEDVSLPNSLTSIEQHVFWQSGLKELTVPESVTYAGGGIFNSCENLISLTLPASFFLSGERFGGGKNLQYVHIVGDQPAYVKNCFNSHTDDFVVYYDPGTFGWTGHRWGDYTILPWGSPDAALNGTCGEDAYWSLENGVLTITGTGPIDDCMPESHWETLDSRIHTVIIEPGITAIGECAFFRLENLKSVSIPGTVETIGIFAFQDCIGLEEVLMAEGTKEIRLWAFRNCASLKNFHMPDTVTDANGSIFTDCTALETVHLSDALTSIPEGTFTHCSALKSFNIPKAATSIGASAFDGCRAITEFTIPEQITSLGYGAFSSSGIRELFIPPWLGSVDGMVFGSSENLQTLHFQGDAPENLYFAGMTLTVYYPAANESWKQFPFDNYGGTVTWIPCETVHEIRETEIPATCTEPGSLSTGCSCGYGTTVTELPPLGHTYENEVCTRCGAAEPKVIGDVDGDGVLSYNDALTVLRYSISLGELADPSVADIDGDGTATYNDALVILRESIGLE